MNPLERVVALVLDGKATGEAKPRFADCCWRDFRAARLRRAWFRLRARRREAIVQRRGEKRAADGGWRRREVKFRTQIIQPIT